MTPDEIRECIAALHNNIKRDLDKPGTLMITPLVLQSHARIVDFASQLADQQTQQLVKAVEQQVESAKIMERQTSQLISLTRALVWLTVGLLIFTVVLAIRG